MYTIRCELPVNREPWNTTLEYRCGILKNAHKNGKKIAAMLYQQADTSTFRYRCYNVAQSTERSQTWQSVYFFMNELHVLETLLPCINVLILTRLKWQHSLDTLVLKARSKNIPVLYDIDDLVCNTKYIKLVTNTLNVHFGGEVDYDFWFAYFSRLEQAAQLADGFLTTNDYLGQKLQDRFQKPYQIIINSLNLEQLEVSSRCVVEKQKKTTKRPFEVGYFSGTPSHINDFKVVASEIVELLRDCPDMILKVVGFMEFPDVMQPLIKAGKIQFAPLVDFLELQKLIAQVDVNIVPLVQNTFTNCKSELKFFEAAAVNTVTVATPIYTYKSAIEHGKTGFLCEQGQWYGCIKDLYNKKSDPSALIQNAREYCIPKYSGESFLKQIEDAYESFL